MVIVGLTGSIGMGKSTAARVLRRLGLPVHDSDGTVHRLLQPGGAGVAPVAAAFPEAARADGIDRRALAALVFGNQEALSRLEGILHPLVRRQAVRFLHGAARRRAPVAVLDVPLLFETGGAGRCDLVAVVSAPEFLQRQRVLRRPGMTPDRLAAILARQTPDREKRRRADIVVPTGLGRRTSLLALKRAVRVALSTRGRVWRPGYLRKGL